MYIAPRAAAIWSSLQCVITCEISSCLHAETSAYVYYSGCVIATSLSSQWIENYIINILALLFPIFAENILICSKNNLWRNWRIVTKLFSRIMHIPSLLMLYCNYRSPAAHKCRNSHKRFHLRVIYICYFSQLSNNLLLDGNGDPYLE